MAAALKVKLAEADETEAKLVFEGKEELKKTGGSVPIY